jgi:hypothetical protein
MLRNAQEYSPSAQVQAAATHVQTLKQNQRKKELSKTLVEVFELEFFFIRQTLGNVTPHAYPEHMHDFDRRATKFDSSSIIGARCFGHMLGCKKETDLIVM